MKIHTNDRKFQCNICMKKFIELRTLKSHILTHTGEKPHVCKFCGNSFSQTASLNLHIRTTHQIIPNT